MCQHVSLPHLTTSQVNTSIFTSQTTAANSKLILCHMIHLHFNFHLSKTEFKIHVHAKFYISQKYVTPLQIHVKSLTKQSSVPVYPTYPCKAGGSSLPILYSDTVTLIVLPLASSIRSGVLMLMSMITPKNRIAIKTAEHIIADQIGIVKNPMQSL